jgi:predicted Ser/Thr protein kinase
MTTRLVAHYRILAPLGGGGMGVVYEAEDSRLGRRVALKFLPPEVARTPDALARFQREARAASALNHPNICSVFDVGEEEGQPFIVMERLEGQTLKHAMGGKALSVAMVLELGAQMADALEAAHAKGIVHRDIKPSNVFVTQRGDVKLLDFGLAKLSAEDSGALDASEATRTGKPDLGTRPGVALGTASYMSPEQARGEEIDRRSDLFSLGAVLYEMATGTPPFPGPSAAAIFEGILGKEPPPLDIVRPEAARLWPIVDKALAKDRTLRYQTAADLRVDLRRAQRAVGLAGPSSGGTEALSRSAGAHPRRARGLWVAAVALVAGASCLAAIWAARNVRQAPDQPRFTQLTHRRGIVTGARFSSDGSTVVYSALWDGRAPEIFVRRQESSASTSLGLPPATLLSLSAKGDLAILLAPAGERGTLWLGTLARVPLAGGPVRPLLEDVLDADWSPDGHDLAVVRWREGQFQLEYPIGTVILRPCPAARLRVSPQGDRLALLDGTGLLLVDRAGHAVELRIPPAHQGLAWAPDGRSLLVDAGDSDVKRTIRRVGLEGSERVVCALAGTLVVHDVSREGRVLIHHGLEHWGVRARAPGEAAEHDASVYADAGVVGLSGDGSQILLWDGSEALPGSALLRPTRGGQALRLGDGHAHGLSEDGRWVALESLDNGKWRLLLVPTGPGELVPLGAGRFEPVSGVWMVESRRIGFNGAEPGRLPRSLLVEVSSTAVRPITPEGTIAIPGMLPKENILARAPDGTLATYSLAGERTQTLHWKLSPQPLPYVEPVRTSGDGRFVYVRTGSVPARISRIEIETGRAAPWNTLGPSDPTGTGHVWSVYMTPDGRGYAYTHGFFLQDLFLISGLQLSTSP